MKYVSIYSTILLSSTKQVKNKERNTIQYALGNLTIPEINSQESLELKENSSNTFIEKSSCKISSTLAGKKIIGKTKEQVASIRYNTIRVIDNNQKQENKVSRDPYPNDLKTKNSTDNKSSKSQIKQIGTNVFSSGWLVEKKKLKQVGSKGDCFASNFLMKDKTSLTLMLRNISEFVLDNSLNDQSPATFLLTKF
jgi:hypothetical protein